MQYALLIYASEQDWANQTEEQGQVQFQEYMSFTKDIVDRGIYKGGEALQPTATATTVRVRDGELLVTDGPYAEAMEIVGGFYMLRAAEGEAPAIASRIPVNDGGAVELRPIME
ncbi:MAG: YciI family protein, partial [Actinomycetota bacterium]